MRVRVTNSFTYIDGIPTKLQRAVDARLSYPVEGAQHAPAFRAHFWDGKEHLMRRSTKTVEHVIPTGALADVEQLFNEHGAEYIDQRRSLGTVKPLRWVGHEPRDYQEEAIQAALEDRGFMTGRGLLHLPIRSGKTVIAGSLIARLGLQTLFVVPSELLLYQTRDVFEASLSPAPVGLIGDGNWKPDRITIATVQSLLARPGKARGLLAQADLLIVDEAHHLEAPAWRSMLLKSDARYKVGLSATIQVSREQPSETSSIWLKAVTGPLLYRVSMARLIREGHIMKPLVLIYPVHHGSGETWGWARAYKELIEESPVRNAAIVDLACEAVTRGLRVLIDTGRIAQMNNLTARLRERGIAVERLYGATPSTVRREALAKLRSRRLAVVVGTVLGEGVDIPELEVVINAEAQKSRKAAIQRMRNLTPSEGKGTVVFVDFADMSNRYLRRHSLERLTVYRSIRGFTVRAVELVRGEKYRFPSDLGGT